MKIINTDLTVSKLRIESQKSTRKRSHLNLHNSFSDKVQRLLISFEKGSFVEPHYHELPHQWEMFIVLSGELLVCVYDLETKIIVEEFVVSSGDVLEFSPKDVHSVECISESATMLEVKEGPFIEEYAKVLLD
jgi:cupin fold WbuC family metalloprotein